jgi:hypothetical protein
MRAKPKTRSHRITSAAVAAFREAQATEATYTACLRGEKRDGKKVGDHCPTCRRYLTGRGALHRALGLRPWQPSPLDADTDEPPIWRGAGDLWAADWSLVRGLRLELKAAQDCGANEKAPHETRRMCVLRRWRAGAIR